MYCKKCNRENPDENNFCEYCGERLRPLDQNEEEKPEELTEEQKEAREMHKAELKKRSRLGKLALSGMCGLVLVIVIVVIALNSPSSSDELDDDDDTGDNIYASDTITLDDGTSISTNEVYILSGVDGSVDEKTTISDVYDLYQSNPIAAENKLDDKYVIICDTVSSVSKNGDGGLWIYTENGSVISFGFKSSDSESSSFAAEITSGDIIAATNYQFQFRYMEKSYQELEWEGEGELAGKFVLKADGNGMLWKSDR